LPLILLLALAAGGGGWLLLRPAPEPETPLVPLSEVVQAISAGAVAELTLAESGTRLTARLSEPREVEGAATGTIAAVVPRGSLALDALERWAAAGIEVQVEPAHGGPDLWRLVPSLALFAVLLVLVLRLHRGGVATRRFQTTPSERRLTLS